jgi:hypothetical protein
MEDGGGDVLGNLPRTRPGRRSEKREPRAKPASGRQSPVAGRQGRGPAAVRDDADPVGDAVRLAARTAGAGLRVANGITRELLRRLPRP